MGIRIVHKISQKAGLLLAVFAAAVIGGAFTAKVLASIPSGSGIFYGCVKADGTLIVKDDNGTGDITCGAQATKIQWNQTGPQGPQGPAGPGGGTVLANELVISQGSLNEGDTPISILSMPDFGVLEATLCDSDGTANLQLHNTTSHDIYLNFDYRNPLVPGATRQNVNSSTLTEGNGNDFRMASTNFYYNPAYQTDTAQCIFDAQAIINTDTQN